jgi:hypothetical protein
MWTVFYWTKIYTILLFGGDLCESRGLPICIAAFSVWSIFSLSSEMLERSKFDQLT